MRLVLILLFAATSLRGEGQTVSFFDLPSGDTIVAQYSTSGCFHLATFRFIFRLKGVGECSIERPVYKWSEDGTRATVEDWVPIGKILLADGQKAKLDALMEFYRSNTRKGCSTKDWIYVSQIHEGKVVAQEEFRDESCEVGGDPNLLSFWTLVLDLERSKSGLQNQDESAAQQRKSDDSGSAESGGDKWGQSKS